MTIIDTISQIITMVIAITISLGFGLMIFTSVMKNEKEIQVCYNNGYSDYETQAGWLSFAKVIDNKVGCIKIVNNTKVTDWIEVSK